MKGGLAERKAKYWPVIAELLGIRPWEIDDRLTVEEFATACRYIDERIAAQEKAEKGGGRHGR